VSLQAKPKASKRRNKFDDDDDDDDDDYKEEEEEEDVKPPSSKKKKKSKDSDYDDDDYDEDVKVSYEATLSHLLASVSARLLVRQRIAVDSGNLLLDVTSARLKCSEFTAVVLFLHFLRFGSKVPKCKFEQVLSIYNLCNECVSREVLLEFERSCFSNIYHRVLRN